MNMSHVMDVDSLPSLGSDISVLSVIILTSVKSVKKKELILMLLLKSDTHLKSQEF